jgi:sigma-B regulation protein RsbU (phosphoserine phosphatase)
MMATVQLAVLEPLLGRLHVSSAGHLPPVLAFPGRPAGIVDVPSDPSVGVPSALRRHSTAINLPAGASLCFYTDGLIERRETSLDVGLKRLCKAVVAAPVESVFRNIMGQLIGDNPLLTILRYWCYAVNTLVKLSRWSWCCRRSRGR